MRIVVLGSIALSVPPPQQGGTEWIAYYQAKGLSEKGHQVLLIAAQGTKEQFKNTTVEVIEVGKGDIVTGAKTERIVDASRTEGTRKLRMEMAYLAEVSSILIERKDSYDVILNNMRGGAALLSVAKLLKKPFVNVMHLPLFSELATVFTSFNTPLITISNAQRKEFPDLQYLATIPNCVDTDLYAFNEVANEYLLMIGSIGKHKNQTDAIRLAKETNTPLILAGKIRDADYYEELKKDIDGEHIIYKGEVGFEEKLFLYQHAKAFVFPILWDEPFGLVMIEAMSCGTPVVAYAHGAIPEVVENGKTGFVVQEYEQMKHVLQKIDTIDRQDCRTWVEEHFTPKKMVDAYESALQKLV